MYVPALYPEKEKECKERQLLGQTVLYSVTQLYIYNHSNIKNQIIKHLVCSLKLTLYSYLHEKQELKSNHIISSVNKKIIPKRALSAYMILFSQRNIK